MSMADPQAFSCRGHGYRLFHRIAASIQAGAERSFERVQSFVVRGLRLIFRLCLRGGCLLRRLLLGCRVGLPLLHTASHGTGGRPDGGSCAGIASDRANRGYPQVADATTVKIGSCLAGFTRRE
jgi:hypothetical protein